MLGSWSVVACGVWELSNTSRTGSARATWRRWVAWRSSRFSPCGSVLTCNLGVNVVQIKMGALCDEEIEEVAQRMDVAEGRVTFQNLQGVCAALGDESRSFMVRPCP